MLIESEVKKKKRKKKKISKENMPKNSEVFDDLYDFYDKSKDWIMDYAEYANKFDTRLVWRRTDADVRSIYDSFGSSTILVLTANAVEQNILTHKLYDECFRDAINKTELPEISIDGFVYQFSCVSNVRIVHLHPTSTSSYTDGGSADAVRKAVKWFQPELVVSLGVAFGIAPKEQHIGDVLISSAVIPYDIFNKDTDGTIKLRSKDIIYTQDVLNAWDVLIRTSDFSLDEERESLIKRKLEFKWYYGALLSGGSVLSNEEKKKALLKAAKDCGEEKVIGGEMEGVGVYSECKKLNIPCIVIKGICDWGAEKNSWEAVINLVNKQHQEDSQYPSDCPSNKDVKNCVQAYAMDHAAEALFRLLRFDSNFLQIHASAEKQGRMSIDACRRKLALCRQGLALKKGRIFQVTGIYFLIAFAAMMVLFLMERFNVVPAVKGYGGRLIAVLAMGLPILAVTFFIGEIKALRPFSVHHPWVNFDFAMLNLAEHKMEIMLRDERQISDVIISWWMSKDKVRMKTREMGKFYSCDVITFETLECFDSETVLQIEYMLKNGEHYVHLISQKSKTKSDALDEKIVYRERIFRVDGSKERLVGVQNAIILNVIRDREP